MMNQCDINSNNASVEALYQHSEKESPPFALDDHFSSNQEHHQIEETETCPSKQYPCSKSISTPSSTENAETDNKCIELVTHSNQHHRSIMTSYSQNSSLSTPPDLVESVMTDGTSCCSALTASNSDVTKSINYQIYKSPPLSTRTAISSCVSTSSLKSVQLEPRANIDFYPVGHGNGTTSIDTTSPSYAEPRTIIRQSDESLGSIGFSELMRAADDSNNIQLGQSRTTTHLSEHRSNSNTRMPPLLESQEVESGALISAAAPEYSSVYDTPVIVTMKKIQKWWHNILLLGSRSYIANRELDTPLLTVVAGTNSNSATSRQPHITRLLSNDSFKKQNANLALERSSAKVQTKVESGDLFEVSLLLGENSQCTVDDVMEVISNTDLLSLWCDPIETLIVTSNSSDSSSLPISVDDNETRRNTENSDFSRSGTFFEDNERVREYEGEWIEATTSALESPSGSASFIFNAGQSILQSLGFASYGRITMFIERRRGHIGLTIGPFHGGIHASHTISVSEDATASNGGRIRIVDRVRLTYDEEDVSLARIFGCTMGSCMSHCFLPSIVGYVDQVTTSMARLRILLENGNAMSPNLSY